jgi:hypothetical protein
MCMIRVLLVVRLLIPVCDVSLCKEGVLYFSSLGREHSPFLGNIVWDQLVFGQIDFFIMEDCIT